MTDRLLHCRNLSLLRGQQSVLEDINLTAHAGDCLAIAGANGAGKTTLLKCLMGAFPEATGEILLAGHDPRLTAPKLISRHYAYAPQTPSSAWDYTVEEFSSLSPHPKKYFHWLERLALKHKAERKLSELSGGERKAAHLCLSLSAGGTPAGKIFLLDEPAASLDICRAQIFTEIIQELTEQGAAVLVATHDLAFIKKCPRAALLKDGRLIATGPTAETLTPAVVREIWESGSV